LWISSPWCAETSSNPAHKPATLSATETVLSATLDISNATTSSATSSTIIDAMEKGAEALTKSVSETIDKIREESKEMLGGDESGTAMFVDRIIAETSRYYFGWPLWQYLLSFSIVFIMFVLRHAIARWLLAVIIKITSRTATTLDDHLVGIFRSLIPPLRIAVTLMGIYIAVHVFFVDHPLPEIPVEPVSQLDQIRYAFRDMFFFLILLNIAWALCRLTDSSVESFAKITEGKDRYLLDNTFVPIVQRTIKVFIFIIITLQALDYFHYGTIVTSLLAAAGVSGLAIGLAAQDTIKNFFGSLVLLVDRPFSIGDWIEAGDTEGIVESVGLRSTKIRTFAKTLITIPNSKIVDRDINNYSRMYVRRVTMTIGVTYDTPADKMEELVNRIKLLLRNSDEVWQDLILVRFTEFGASSLNIFIYYFSKTIQWDAHLAVREKMNLEIMRILESMNLEFAFPTQTIHIKKESSGLVDCDTAQQEINDKHEQ
jgi:MscS family membrane protein